MLRFKAYNHFLPTEFVQFYLRFGALIEIDYAIHYVGSNSLANFVEKQKNLRIQADLAGHPEKSFLAKTILNSSYGRYDHFFIFELHYFKKRNESTAQKSS